MQGSQQVLIHNRQKSDTMLKVICNRGIFTTMASNQTIRPRMNGCIFCHIVDIAMNGQPTVFWYSVFHNGFHENGSLKVGMPGGSLLQIDIVRLEKEIGSQGSHRQSHNTQQASHQSTPDRPSSTCKVFYVFFKDWIPNALGCLAEAVLPVVGR